MNGIIKLLVDLFFPPRCVFCGEVIERGKIVCDKCPPALNRLCGELCFFCGKYKNDCVCSPEPFSFERCISPFAYDGRVQHGIIELKRSKSTPATEFFAAEMSKRIREEFAGIEFTYVSYVPSAPDSSRGFNQAELLAQAVSHETGIPFLKSPVKKLPGAKTQHMLNSSERHVNARESYVSGGGTAQGAVLLIDDVMTTGSTLDRCAHLLKQAGAESVYCVAAAATLRRGIHQAEDSD